MKTYSKLFSLLTLSTLFLFGCSTNKNVNSDTSIEEKPSVVLSENSDSLPDIPEVSEESEISSEEQIISEEIEISSEEQPSVIISEEEPSEDPEISSEEIEVSEEISSEEIEVIGYTVTFHLYEDQVYTTDVQEGTCVESYEATRNGFNFIGWYTSEEILYDFSLAITSNLDLYAKWELQFGPIV